jgi:hypothetical protein
MFERTDSLLNSKSVASTNISYKSFKIRIYLCKIPTMITISFPEPAILGKEREALG